MEINNKDIKIIVLGHSLDEIKEFIEYNKEKKPIVEVLDCLCPTCESYVDEFDCYCKSCGQKLDWTELRKNMNDFYSIPREERLLAEKEERQWLKK